ncbi:MAG: heparan-alpha-glucosaminide N-acetyltransferase domain-containing protein, partial [Oscillospiraceae bacterium]
MPTKKLKNQNRVHLLDEIRGFAIICMVIYHAVYDFLTIFEIDFPFYYSGIMDFIVTVFVFAFVSISGAACLYSHNNLKRGSICFLFGMLLTAVTYFILPEELILFGILHMLGISMMIYALLEKWINKINVYLLITISVIIFIITYGISEGYIGFLTIEIFKLPKVLYETNFLYS